MTTTAVDVALTGDVLALVADRAAASDESGHLDPEVVAALAAAGINRLVLPVELGGFAVSPRRTVEVVEQLAAVDGSAAWAAAIGFGTSLFAGYLPPDGAAEVFADPDRSNASMFAPLAEVTDAPDGTLRLTGRWPFTSNCEQAAWIGLGARFPGEPVPRLVFAPRSEVTIHPTWDVAGLRATASNDTAVTDLEVHRRRTCSFADRPWPEGPLWRLPLFVALAPVCRRPAMRTALQRRVGDIAVALVADRTRARTMPTKATSRMMPAAPSSIAAPSPNVRATRVTPTPSAIPVQRGRTAALKVATATAMPAPTMAMPCKVIAESRSCVSASKS